MYLEPGSAYRLFVGSLDFQASKTSTFSISVHFRRSRFLPIPGRCSSISLYRLYIHIETVALRLKRDCSVGISSSIYQFWGC